MQLWNRPKQPSPKRRPANDHPHMAQRPAPERGVVACFGMGGRIFHKVVEREVVEFCGKPNFQREKGRCLCSAAILLSRTHQVDRKVVGMTIESTPAKFEIYDGQSLIAKVKMFDDVASNIKIKTLVSPETWPELSDAILSALKQMHPERQE